MEVIGNAKKSKFEIKALLHGGDAASKLPVTGQRTSIELDIKTHIHDILVTAYQMYPTSFLNTGNIIPKLAGNISIVANMTSS